MYYRIGIIVIVGMLLLSRAAPAQDDQDERDALKIAAIEALIMAPPERAFPAVRKVLRGDNSDDVKEAALFILSQIDSPEAHALLLETAQESDGDLREEAITMIGISGGEAALGELKTLYDGGDQAVREAVLEAYLIAHETDRVYEIAVAAADVDEFEMAVETLAAMGAIEALRRLRQAGGNAEALVEAYAIAGDFQTLREMALDDSDEAAQIEAIGALGIIGSGEANETLLQMYRDSDDRDVKEAALEGMMISGYDAGVLMLYRESDDNEEKRELLEFLTYMGSDQVWDLIDETLENRR